MQSIKITKEYTFEEIRDDFKERMQTACEELQETSKDLDTICSSLDLKILNLANFNENVNVARRSLFMIDQVLGQIMTTIEAISVQPVDSSEDTPEVKEDGQAG